MIVNLDRLATEVEAELDPTYKLIYVDYRDELSREQIAMLARHDMDSLWESTEEWESESSWDSACDIADELAGNILDRWEREASKIIPDEDWDDMQDQISALRNDWQASDERYMVIETIRSRDTSDVVAMMARQTPDVLMRARIGDDDFDADWGTEVDPTEFIEWVGLDPTEPNVKAAQSIIDNAQTYGTVYLLVTMSPSDLLGIGPEDTITFTDPHVLLSNGYAGNGHEEQMFGDVTIPASDLRTDRDAFGYSWTEIAGPYVPAYATTHKINHKTLTQ